MVSENQVPEYRNNSVLGFLAGLLLGGLAGATAMLLLAPQSGEDTRNQIQKKGIELRDRTTGIVEDTMAQLRARTGQFKADVGDKAQELKQQGQDVLVEQLDRVSAAAEAGKKAVQGNHR